MSLTTTSFNIPKLKVGIGGNYYVVCDWKEKLIALCQRIDKSPNSIYFNKKYNCWAIRVKNKSTKERLLTIMSEGYIMLN